MIRERLGYLKEKMKEQGIDFYIIPTSDYHNSEYVSDHFKCREYMSGFNGSAGTLVVSEKETGLWTDGRYFIQAEEQLLGTGITLFKSGNKDVPGIKEYLSKKNKEMRSFRNRTITVGFDGRVVTTAFVKKLGKETDGINIIPNLDLVGSIWEDRPALPATPIYVLPEKYTGCSSMEKLLEIRRRCRENECDYHMVSSLDDIAWILNLRGNDIACNPVFLSYLFIAEDYAILFCNKKCIDQAVERYLENLGVQVRSYESVFDYLKDFGNRLTEKPNIHIDCGNVNYNTYEAVCKSFTPKNGMNPSTSMKAEKNPVELENLRQANIIDGVAMVRFLKWLDDYAKDPETEPVTELDAAGKLLEFRKENRDFKDISFDTIAAYGPHGAIVHYEPTPESDAVIEKKGFLLVDSGAHYLKGTTDITRTVAMGDLSPDMRKHYTAVLKGNLDLASAVFPAGTAGANLDILARGPLWKLRKDYNHGTGHGIGYFLNVHEGPQNINWKIGKRHGNDIPLACGMVVSDEPGFYLAGEYGIRTENDIAVVKKEENGYDTYLGFEVLTLAPIDVTPVIWEDMTREETEFLNDYHKTVYEKLSPYLDTETAEWLKDHTAPHIG